MSSLSFAYLLMLGAFACFSCMDTSAKWLVGAAIPALQVAWLRYMGHFILNCLIYLPRHGVGIAHSNSPRLQFLRSGFLFTSTVLNFTALQYLPLTITIAIFFVAPLAVCLISIPVLGERVGFKRILAILTGFLGVLIIVRPWSATFDPRVFISIAAMLFAAGYFVISRMAAGRDSNATTQFYISGISASVLGPLALYHWVWPGSWQDWIVIVLIGSLGMIGHSLLSHAHRLAEASVLAPTIYSQAVFIAILSWVIFAQPPDAETMLGTAVIIGSGLFVWYRERQLNKQS
ncbi:MAG: DMT family transporter [Granulosicoccus sp.]|nr:DMT family transporter [Granulosicoccus sp.]